MSATEEALKIWNALKPMVDRQIEAKTRSCVRAKKMLVTSAPSGSVIGVSEPYGEEILIPYLSTLSGVSVGDAVWVWYYFNNASTMIAMAMGNGQMGDMSGGAAIIENIPGTDPVITGEANHMYICGEVSTLSFTPPASGLCSVVFTSGASATALTIPNTVEFASGFNPANLQANTTYELSILNGTLGLDAAWGN